MGSGGNAVWAFIAGVICGAVAGYSAARKRFEQDLDLERAEKEDMANRLRSDEIIQNQGYRPCKYNSVGGDDICDEVEDPAEDECPTDDEPDLIDPYILDEDELDDVGMGGQDYEDVTYFPQDDVLINSATEQSLDDIDPFGKDVRNQIRLRKDRPDEVFVRNEHLGIDYDVTIRWDVNYGEYMRKEEGG